MFYCLTINAAPSFDRTKKLVRSRTIVPFLVHVVMTSPKKVKVKAILRLLCNVCT